MTHQLLTLPPTDDIVGLALRTARDEAQGQVAEFRAKGIDPSNYFMLEERMKLYELAVEEHERLRRDYIQIQRVREWPKPPKP